MRGPDWGLSKHESHELHECRRYREDSVSGRALARADKKESESEAAIERIFLDDRPRSALFNKGCFCFEVPLEVSFHGSSPENQLII